MSIYLSDSQLISCCSNIQVALVELLITITYYHWLHIRNNAFANKKEMSLDGVKLNSYYSSLLFKLVLFTTLFYVDLVCSHGITPCLSLSEEVPIVLLQKLVIFCLTLLPVFVLSHHVTCLCSWLVSSLTCSPRPCLRHLAVPRVLKLLFSVFDLLYF